MGNINLCSLALLLLFTSYEAQQRTRTSSQFRIQASGTDLEELSSSVEESFEKALAGISRDGDSLQVAVNELAASLTQTIANVMVTIISSDQIDAQQEARIVSQAIGQALLAASKTAGSEFSQLNIDAITLDIRNAVESTLSGATSESKPEELTREVAIQVLNSVGNALAEVTGGSFEANVQVNATQTEPVIAFISTSGNVQDLNAQFETALQGGNVTLATTLLISLLSQGGFGQFAGILVSGENGQQLVDITVNAVSQPSFPAWPFTDAIAAAYASNSEAVVDYLKNVLLRVSTAGGLAESIAFAYQRGGDARRAFDSAISSAVSSDGCNSIKSILDEGTVYAQQKGVATSFLQQLQENDDIRRCTSTGLGVVVSVELFGSFSNPRNAARQIRQAATEGREDAIARTINSGVRQGEADDVIETLVLVLEDESTPTSPITNAISTASTLGDEEVQDALVRLFRRIGNEQEVNTAFSIILSLAFAPGRVETTDSFTQIIKGSIQGGNCPLKDEMEAALARTSGADRDSFVATINADEDLKKCVSFNLLEAPAPTPSPLPDSQTLLEEGCTNIAPDDVYTCEDQKEFGKCDNAWMINGGYCKESCGRCEEVSVATTSPTVDEACDDTAPDDVHTCEQQQKFGKCDSGWMVSGGFCRQTCGRCPDSVSVAPASPAVPDGEESVLDIISRTTRVSALLTALQQADLDGMLTRPTGEYTILAPTNAAFTATLERLGLTLEDLLGNKPLLEEIVGYHVIPEIYSSTDFTDGQVLLTINQPETVTVEVNGQTNFVGTASRSKLLVPDLRGSNGVIHLVDAVLLPIRPSDVSVMTEATRTSPAPDTPQSEDSITEVISQDDRLGTLSLVLEAGGLSTVLSNPNTKYTVFAPTDAAFAEIFGILNVTPEQLAQDLRTLRTILRFHIVNADYPSSSLENGLSIPTLNVPQRVSITKSGDTVTVTGPENSGDVVVQDIPASNGVVHIINTVLLPFSPGATPSAVTTPTKTIMGVVEESPELSTLVTALKRAGLDTVLRDNSQKYTLFAPSNDAFDEFPLGLDEVLNLGDELVELLQYHVTPQEYSSSELTDGQVLNTVLPEQSLTIKIPNAIVVIGTVNEGEVLIPDVPASNGIIHFIDSILLPSSVPSGDSSCEDIAPDDAHTCEDQYKFGKCDAAWLINGGFCAKTCGRCPSESAPTTSPAPSIMGMTDDEICDCECGCCFDDPENIADKVTAMVREQLTQAILDARSNS